MRHQRRWLKIVLLVSLAAEATAAAAVFWHSESYRSVPEGGDERRRAAVASMRAKCSAA